MTKYIKLDDAIRTAIQAVCAFNISREGVGITQFDAVDVADRMEMIPAADVAEVKHGEWIPQIEYNFEIHDDDLAGYCCSICGLFYIEQHNFCPNCGAKMEDRVPIIRPEGKKIEFGRFDPKSVTEVE